MKTEIELLKDEIKFLKRRNSDIAKRLIGITKDIVSDTPNQPETFVDKLGDTPKQKPDFYRVSSIRINPKNVNPYDIRSVRNARRNK